VNSYKGLVERVGSFEGGTVTWAPTYITYGYNNRSAMLRLPQSRFAIENRATDMTMNPYLSFAMTVAASLKGIRDQIDPGPPTETSLYDTPAEELRKAGRARLPRTLVEAIEAFNADPLARDVFGSVMHQSFSRYKHDEWNRYSEQISRWEQEEYMRLY
jgi:glutamine synthetase